MSNYAKQDPFAPQQHQASPQYDTTQHGQYTGVVYPEQAQYQAYQQQPPPTSPGPLTHQNTMVSMHSAIMPVNEQRQQTIPIPIQPDPLPKALTTSQTSPVTAQQVAAMYPGATVGYEARLTAPDGFHESMCGCFGDFFSCKNMSTCCCGMWCPCVLYSRIHYRLRHRNPRDLNGFSSCNSQCWNSCCFGGAVHARQRDELRHRYRLEGGCCSDCLRHCCCGPCTLCQEEKELLYREKELDTLIKAGAYQSAPQMVYPGGPGKAQ